MPERNAPNREASCTATSSGNISPTRPSLSPGEPCVTALPRFRAAARSPRGSPRRETGTPCPRRQSDRRSSRRSPVSGGQRRRNASGHENEISPASALKAFLIWFGRYIPFAYLLSCARALPAFQIPALGIGMHGRGCPRLRPRPRGPRGRRPARGAPIIRHASREPGAGALRHGTGGDPEHDSRRHPRPGDPLPSTFGRNMSADGSSPKDAIRYQPDERPPVGLALGLGLQLAVLTIPGIMLITTVVMRAAGETEAYLYWAASATVAISGAATVLQAFRVGRFGTGHVLVMEAPAHPLRSASRRCRKAVRRCSRPSSSLRPSSRLRYRGDLPSCDGSSPRPSRGRW